MMVAAGVNGGGKSKVSKFWSRHDAKAYVLTCQV